jgi:hypothetical protein
MPGASRYKPRTRGGSEKSVSVVIVVDEKKEVSSKSQSLSTFLPTYEHHYRNNESQVVEDARGNESQVVKDVRGETSG